MMLIQFKHSDCSLCADEIFANLEFKKKIIKIS